MDFNLDQIRVCKQRDAANKVKNATEKTERNLSPCRFQQNSLQLSCCCDCRGGGVIVKIDFLSFLKGLVCFIIEFKQGYL